MALLRWETANQGGNATIEQLEIRARASALLLVDVQNGNVDPACGAGPGLTREFPALAHHYYGQLEQALPAVRRLAEVFREWQLPLVHSLSVAVPSPPAGAGTLAGDWRTAAERSLTSIPWLRPATDLDVAPWSGSAPVDGEIVLHKHTLSPFNSTALDQLLHNLDVDTLVIAGVLTNVAVETTVRDAADRGYNVILVSDACAALTPEDHAAPTERPNWFVVRTVAEIEAELGAALVADAEVAS
jgi:nicotinamidase-related amidase